MELKFDSLVKNAKIPQGDQAVLTNILINDGKIAGFIDNIEGIDTCTVIDAEGNLTLPGCIDSHVHFMDPGFTHRENFLSGTKAAAAGGITTVIDMPCCSIPSVRDVASLKNKIDAIKNQAIVDFALWGGATGEDVRNNALSCIEEQAKEGVIGFKAYMTPSVPSYPRANDAELYEIFEEVAKTGLPVGIHAENFVLCDYNVKKFENEGRLDGPAWSEARLALAEKVAIELGISFSEATGARLHIVHMSTGIGAILIEQAKIKGLKVTAETCPHYLVLNAQDAMTKWGSFAKIAPPLRSFGDNITLWSKVANGAVDFIATDHAPYEIPTEKKAENMNIWTSFPGIPGVETMVPIMVSEGYNKGKISLSRLVEILSTNAAKHYGLYPRKGSMNIGADADLTIIDLNKEWQVNSSNMQSKANYSPFDGMSLKGKVTKTIVRGKLVYNDDNFYVEPGFGKFIKRENIAELERKLVVS